MPTDKDQYPIFIDSQSPSRPRLRIPPEPWYYGALDSLARFLFALCAFLVGVALIVGLIGAIWVLGGEAGAPLAKLVAAAITAIVPLVLTALSLIGTLILALALRLSVDIARNVRSLRYS